VLSDGFWTVFPASPKSNSAGDQRLGAELGGIASHEPTSRKTDVTRISDILTLTLACTPGFEGDLAMPGCHGG